MESDFCEEGRVDCDFCEDGRVGGDFVVVVSCEEGMV